MLLQVAAGSYRPPARVIRAGNCCVRRHVPTAAARRRAYDRGQWDEDARLYRSPAAGGDVQARGAGLEHTRDLGDRLVGDSDMLEDLVGEHEVERGIGSGRR